MDLIRFNSITEVISRDPKCPMVGSKLMQYSYVLLMRILCLPVRRTVE